MLRTRCTRGLEKEVEDQGGSFRQGKKRRGSHNKALNISLNDLKTGAGHGGGEGVR